MGTVVAETVAEFRQAILDLLRKEAVRLHVPPCGDVLPSIAFDSLIRDVAATSKDGQCVVLVDEYDKPLLRYLSRPDVTAFRDELKPFYGVVKYAEEKQRFTFLTGVSKFSKVSIFSDLNNLIDLTMTTFLTDALKKQPLDFSTIGIDQSALEAYEPDNPRLVTLLYQTGYLTIKGFRQIGEFRRYDLCMPNLEVENSFFTQLAPVYAGLDADRSINYQFAAADALIAGDAAKFVKVLGNFCANIPYNLTDRQNEQMWQTIVYVLLKSVGFGVNAEVLTNEGRIDMTCETPAGIWLIEFKLDRPAEEALAQIEEKNYADKYAFAGKKVLKLGISFSSEKRTIVDWRMA